MCQVDNLIILTGITYLWTANPLPGVYWQTQRQSSKEAYGHGDQALIQENVLEILLLEAIIFGYEVHVVREIGGVGALCLHVAFDSGRLAGRSKMDGEFEQAAGDFGMR